MCFCPIAGQVLKWEVMCETSGQVMLAIWRGSPHSLTLIGKNRVTVPAGMEDKLVVSPSSEHVFGNHRRVPGSVVMCKCHGQAINHHCDHPDVTGSSNDEKRDVRLF